MYYFAFGPDLNKKLMAERCPGCKPRLSAVLPNYKLIFAGWSRQLKGGTAAIKRSTGDKVLGGVYEISEKDMARLDAAEGCPGTTNRVKVNVFSDSDEPVEVWTYVRTRPAEESRPSPEYLAGLQQGYRDWGLV
jgi:gamma-glutamylcyclotransferase (GGCT)/AIG2-like uncharacterized protein YtfP